MWQFKETKKAELLQGRTIKYLAEKKLFISYPYLVNILKGKRSCSKRLANDITHCISWDAKLEDYFYEKGD